MTRESRAPGEASDRRDGGSAVLVKLGGSLITEKSGDADAREGVIRRLAAEVAEGAVAAGERVLVGHGSGSFGHPPAAEHELHRGARSEEERRAASRTQDRAARLHRRVVAALVEEGVATFSVAPSSAAVAEDGELVSFAVEPTVRALEGGFVPVTYGDVVADRRLGVTIASTESVFLRLTKTLGREGWTVRRALWLGTTPGVYGPDGRVVPRLGAGRGERIPDAVRGSQATDVTGGMRHRVQAALRLAELGVESWIGDGRIPGALARALAGEPEGGTGVRPPAD